MSTTRSLAELKGLTCTLNGVSYTFEPKNVTYGVRKNLESIRFEGVNFDRDGKPDNLMKVKDNLTKAKEGLLRAFFAVPSSVNLDDCDVEEIDAMLAIVDEADLFREKKTETTT